MAKSKRKKTTKLRVQKTIWSKDEENIFKRRREEWQNLEGRQEREEFYARVGEEIRDLQPERYGVMVVGRNRLLKEEWDRRVKAIKTWFNNHRGNGKSRRIFKFERKVQLRNVVAHYKRDEIEDEVHQLCPGEKPGSRNYFRNYQKALRIVIDQLDDNELQFYKDKQKEWQDHSPPSHVQRRAAKKYGKRIILNMHEVAFKQMGMHAVTIEAHRNENGDVGLTFHDYNKDLAPSNVTFQSFLEYNRKACSDFSKAFGEWVLKVLDATEGRSSTVETGPDVLVSFAKGPGGIPIIPDPITGEGQVERLKTQRHIIREFFRMHYRLATRNENVHPPWEAMGLYPNDFFFPGGIPEGFVMRDPTRLPGAKVRQLLQHLRESQSLDTQVPFSFRQVFINEKFVDADYPSEAVFHNQSQPRLSELTDEEDMDEEGPTQENPTVELRARSNSPINTLNNSHVPESLGLRLTDHSDGTPNLSANIFHSPTLSPINERSGPQTHANNRQSYFEGSSNPSAGFYHIPNDPYHGLNAFYQAPHNSYLGSEGSRHTFGGSYHTSDGPYYSLGDYQQPRYPIQEARSMDMYYKEVQSRNIMSIHPSQPPPLPPNKPPPPLPPNKPPPLPPNKPTLQRKTPIQVHQDLTPTTGTAHPAAPPERSSKDMSESEPTPSPVPTQPTASAKPQIPYPPSLAPSKGRKRKRNNSLNQTEIVTRRSSRKK